MREIYHALRQSYEKSEKAVLATIVSVEGSVYRQSGARCVIRPDGQIIGIVSGGCVEKDLFYYAEQVWETGKPQFAEYDFRSEDDLIWGMGLGCNGALKLWLQPFDKVADKAAADEILEEWHHRMTTDDSYLVATLVEISGVSADGSVTATDADESSSASVAENTDATPVPDGAGNKAGEVHSPSAMALGHMLHDEELSANGLPEKSGLYTVVSGDVSRTWYVERVEPRTHLVVVGAGADALPVIQAAQFVGWRITLVDHRADWATSVNFPGVDAYQVIGRKEYESFAIPKKSSVVLMTHQYDLDFQALKNALLSDTSYVGALGPRKRLNQMLDEWRQKGTRWTEETLSKLFSPIGLDIGSETPEEIAMAIVSEVMAKHRGRTGQSLRERADAPIHVVDGV